MASTGVESEGGTESTGRRREEEGTGDDDAMFYHNNSVDDELAMLMPALTRRFQALEADNDGTLNIVRGPNMGDENNFAHNDKENAVSNRRTFQQFKRRQGSDRIITSRPIVFDNLLTKNKTLASPPSGSLYKNITTVLKENVNTKVHSQIVDDFWSTERQRKISAVARRRLTGSMTLAQDKPQPVENRHIRHARSRRGGRNSRKVGERPIKLDLDLDAFKISEWDQEKLAVEEETPWTRTSSRPFMSAGRPVLEDKFKDGEFTALDQGRRNVVPVGANRGGGRQEEYEDVETSLQGGSDPNHLSEAAQKARSHCSLSDMDLSLGESPSFQIPECPLTSPTPNSNPVAMSLRSLEGNIGQRRLAFLSSSSSETIDTGKSFKAQRFDIGEVQPQRDLCRGGKTQMTASLEDFQGEKLDGVEVKLSRNLSGGGSPSFSKDDFNIKKLDFGAVESLRDFCNVEVHCMAASKDEVEDEKLDSGEVESRQDLFDGGTNQMTASREVAEVEEQQHSNEISPTAPCNDVTLQDNDEKVKESLSMASGDEVFLHVDRKGTALKVDEAKADGIDSPERHHYSSERCYNKTPVEYSLFNSKAGSPSQGGNALLAISQNYPDDDIDLKMPDVNEAELLRGQSIGSDKAEHPLGTRSAQNFEGSRHELDDDVITNRARDEDLTGKDEGSSTQTKPKRVRRKTVKAQERRSSLEDSGSLWKDGQRRSQRIRVRPLEWWRGEKLLYGRVHDSLTTIIGIKHSSPGKYACGIDTPFTVESYVPAQYNELVRLAAI